MDATVTLAHGMTFIGRPDSGFAVQMGTGPEAGGDDDGPRPMELMLLSIGGCTAMDVVSILRKKRQDLEGLEVKLHAGRATDYPTIFTDVNIHYIVRGRSIDPASVERAIELSYTKYCPAQAIVAYSAPITHTYEIVEVDTEAAPG
jgi:putative redox protein